MPSAIFVTTVSITLEAFLLPFADHFRDAGWRIDALANGASANARLEGHFDEVHDIGWTRNPLSLAGIRSGGRVRSLIEQVAYDVVHVHTPVAAYMTRGALRRLPSPVRPAVVYTAHGFHFFRGQAAIPHAVFRGLERRAAPWTDRIVTVNQEDYEAAQAFPGIPADHVRLIPGIGVDTDLYSPDAVTPGAATRVRAELGVPEAAFMIAMIAEFSPVKRHTLAIEAMSRIPDLNVVLVLAGDGGLEPTIRRKVAERGLEGRVVFAGYRRDIPELLAAADAAMLVSAREGLNRAVLEAMSCARPVFGTAVRGILDAVGDEAGWLVERDGAAGLAAAIRAAVADPGQVAARGKAARLRAQEHFSLDRVLHAYEGLYGEVIASRV
jgi:glycosyltransferase involved in cell wall biosynthesis